MVPSLFVNGRFIIEREIPSETQIKQEIEIELKRGKEYMPFSNKF
jgi:hypothetical protein